MGVVVKLYLNLSKTMLTPNNTNILLIGINDLKTYFTTKQAQRHTVLLASPLDVSQVCIVSIKQLP